MTFSPLDSALTGPLFATEAMRAVFADRAVIAAMLRAEAALAEAEAANGLAPLGLAPAIRAISPDALDLAAIGEAAATAGVPVIPFVKAVEAKLPEDLRSGLHRGATTQDIADTALTLQMAAAFPLIAADLKAILAGLARLADRNRRVPMAGRTYGQHAAPLTFGAVAAIWLSGIVEVAADLPRIRDGALVASLGGPVGTLTGLGSMGPKVAAGFARALGLSAPVTAGHVTRARMAATGFWLASLIAALAKMAEDVARLSSTEIGEVAEPNEPGRGGSSAMPHKQNPVSATVILAAHSAAKGHVVTLLDAVAAEHQRPVGLWHAEWHALPALFGLASGALREARRLAEGLTVDKTRMRVNIDLSHGLMFADAAAAALAPVLGRKEAHALVAEAAVKARQRGQRLEEILDVDFRIPEEARGRLVAAFDLAPAIGAASALVDRVLAETRQVGALLKSSKRNR